MVFVEFCGRASQNGGLQSRKNQVEGEAGLGLAEMFGVLVKARVRVDFRYHSLMGTMEEFRNFWCFNSAVCTVQEGKLFFTLCFNECVYLVIYYILKSNLKYFLSVLKG